MYQNKKWNNRSKTVPSFNIFLKLNKLSEGLDNDFLQIYKIDTKKNIKDNYLKRLLNWKMKKNENENICEVKWNQLNNWPRRK